MPPTSVLLVRSATLNWAGLRATLQDWPEMHIVADVQRCQQAIQVASRERPDLIFTASDLPGIPPVPLIRDLCAASPLSQIIIIGKLLEPDAYSQLADLTIAGFLQWKDLTTESLRHVIETVRTSDVRVVSKAVVDVMLHPYERRRQPRGAHSPVLTPQERGVLLGLARGLTQQQIATAEGVCLRTIEDHIAILKEKFGASTTFTLGVQAERAGFVPEPTTAGTREVCAGSRTTYCGFPRSVPGYEGVPLIRE